MPSDPNCWYYTEEIAKTANSAAILANDISICSLNIVAIPLNVFFNGFVITKYLFIYLFIYLFKSIYWTMSKRQSANGTQSPMRGTPPLQTVKIS